MSDRIYECPDCGKSHRNHENGDARCFECFSSIHGAATIDMVNHPPHYTAHPSGVECIQITEHMGFNLGNALKYIWRADEKGNATQDLEKAKWYIERELQKRAQS